MDGILLLSIEPEPLNESIEKFIKDIKKYSGIERIYNIDLKSNHINLENAIQRLVAVGAKKIKVVPTFLMKSTEYNVKIPIELRYIESKYHNIDIKIDENFIEFIDYNDVLNRFSQYKN
jgi:sirohydrochlorin ferrochelatase